MWNPLALFSLPTLIRAGHELILRAAKPGEEKKLYELILELASFEGKNLDLLPLTEGRLKKYGFSKNPIFSTEFAEYNDEIIGYALYYFTFTATEGSPILYLEDLYVKPQFRKSGIGYKIIKKLSHYAKENGCCRMEWHVHNWNESAMRFYEKLGAKPAKDLIQMRLRTS